MSTPPASTPTAAPEPPSAPQMPSALFRSGPSSNVVVMIDSAAGVMSAAPKPCTAREAISTPSDHARPQRNDATVKITTPISNTRRRPSRSAARPPSRRKPPNVIAYAVITHCRSSREKWSDRPIDGSATFTIETSSTVMKKAAQTIASAFQRFGSADIRRDASYAKGRGVADTFGIATRAIVENSCGRQAWQMSGVAGDGEEDERLLHREAPLVDEEPRALLDGQVERLHEVRARGAVHDPAVGELGHRPRSLLALEQVDADRHLAGDLDAGEADLAVAHRRVHVADREHPARLPHGQIDGRARPVQVVVEVAAVLARRSRS